MNTTPNRAERRKFHDPSPRCTYATNSVLDNTKLVSLNGYAHIALLALGWTALVTEPDFVLMKAPPEAV